MKLFQGLFFLAAFLPWAIGLWSIVQAMAAGKKAAMHLGPTERDYYVRQLLMAPGAPYVQELLGGKGLDEHQRATVLVRRAHLAFGAFALMCIIAVASSMLLGGL